MLPFSVTILATVPQGSEIPEGLMNNPVYTEGCKSRYTVMRVIQSKTVYLLLHPSVCVCVCTYIYKLESKRFCNFYIGFLFHNSDLTGDIQRYYGMCSVTLARIYGS